MQPKPRVSMNSHGCSRRCLVGMRKAAPDGAIFTYLCDSDAPAGCIVWPDIGFYLSPFSVIRLIIRAQYQRQATRFPSIALRIGKGGLIRRNSGCAIFRVALIVNFRG